MASTGINRFTGRPLSNWEHTFQCLCVIFETHFGERVMRRTFGSAIPGLLGHENLTPSTLLKFYTAMAIAVELWEPRFRIRGFDYPAKKNNPDGVRQGKLGITMRGDYRPRALEGDLTVESVKEVVL